MQELIERNEDELFKIYFTAKSVKNPLIAEHFAYQYLEKKLWQMHS